MRYVTPHDNCWFGVEIIDSSSAFRGGHAGMKMKRCCVFHNEEGKMKNNRKKASRKRCKEKIGLVWVRLLSTMRLTWVEQISQPGNPWWRAGRSWSRRLAFRAKDVHDYVQSESNLNNTRGLLQPTAQELAYVGFSWWIAWLEFMASFCPSMVSGQGSFCVNINAAPLNFC